MIQEAVGHVVDAPGLWSVITVVANLITLVCLIAVLRILRRRTP